MMTQTDTGRDQSIAETIPGPITSGPHAWSAAVAERDQATDLALEVFVAHQDLTTGLRARHALDYVSRQLRLGHPFHVNLWRFELLEAFALREEAIRSASRSDILFLSLHGNRPLSAGLCHWFKHWTVMRQDRSCALVISFDESDRESESGRRTLGYLRTMAETAGVEVFPHFGFTCTEVSLAATAEARWNSSAVLSRAALTQSRIASRDWGINE